VREASRLASEAMTVVESLADPTLTVGLSFPVIYAKIERGEWPDVLRWSQRVVDLANGDPFMGNFIFGSPLALALTSRAMARYCLGRPGWRDDLRDGLAMARTADPLTYAGVIAWTYFPGIPNGVRTADERALGEIEDARQIAQRAGNDMAFSFSAVARGMVLVHRQTAAERDSGETLLAEVSDVFTRFAHNLGDRPLVDVYVARERARRGDRDEAIVLMRAAIDHLVGAGQLLAWGIPATAVLVQTLLDRGSENDVAEAVAAIERLASAPAEYELVIREVWLLQLRALVARTHGDAAAYADFRDRYRDMAKTLGYEGHIAWAEAMP
jgi:hypothetical protein